MRGKQIEIDRAREVEGRFGGIIESSLNHLTVVAERTSEPPNRVTGRTINERKVRDR